MNAADFSTLIAACEAIPGRCDPTSDEWHEPPRPPMLDETFAQALLSVAGGWAFLDLAVRYVRGWRP